MNYYGSVFSLADVNPTNSYGWGIRFKRGSIFSFFISIFGIPHLGARVRHRLLVKIVKDWQVGESVFDVGCGFGLESLYLRGLGFEVFGIDRQSYKIETAKILAERLKDREVRFEKKDIFKIKKLRRKFDHAILFEILEHVVTPKEMLLKVSGFIKKGGEIVVSFPSTHMINAMSKSYLGHEYIGYSPKYIQSLVNRYGLKIEKVYTFGNSLASKVFFYIDYFLLRFFPPCAAALFFLSYPLLVFDMDKLRSKNPLGYILVLRKKR